MLDVFLVDRIHIEKKSTENWRNRCRTEDLSRIVGADKCYSGDPYQANVM